MKGGMKAFGVFDNSTQQLFLYYKIFFVLWYTDPMIIRLNHLFFISKNRTNK